MFSNMLAYPEKFVDPGRNIKDRDDGEVMLSRLRTCWNLLDEANHQKTSLSISKCILGSLASNTEYVSLIKDGLMKPNARLKPRVCLFAPSTIYIPTSVMDTHQTNEERKNCMVAIKGSTESAVLKTVPKLLPKPIVFLNFNMDCFKVHIPEMRQNSTVEVSRGLDESTNTNVIIVDVCSFTGSKKQIVIKPQNETMLNHIFDSNFLQSSNEYAILPSLPSHIPFQIQERFAQFWNDRMRANVLVAACQPPTNKSERTLCFSSVSLKETGRQHGSKKMALIGTLHHSSSECICAAHSLKPMEERFPKQRFTGSNVTFKISMCGNKLFKLSPDMPYATCPSCKHATPCIPSIPDVCCSEASIEVCCGHFTTKKEFKPGLSFRSIPMDDGALLHAQTILASAIRCSDAVSPMIGKRPPDDIAIECELQSNKLNNALELLEGEEVDSKKRKLEEESAAQMDQKALKYLRTNNFRQVWKRSQRQNVLAKEDAETGCTSGLKEEDAGLNKLHKWMFPKKF